MIISKEEPAVYKECQRVFRVGEWKVGIVIAYYPNIYCINDLSERPDIIVHEQTHLVQQDLYGVEKWWERYLTDPKFRLEQEVPAYRNQIAYMRKNYNGNRNKRLIQCFCRDMVALYGDMISSEAEAYKLIT